jgi:hypothetical protein
MKIFEILTEAKVGKSAMDYKRSNRYPDGEAIPDSLPPRYQPASFPGVPAKQNCANCGYYDTDTRKCDKFKGEPVVRPLYWCLKWEPMEEEVTEGVAGPKSCWPGHRKVGTQPGTGKNKGKRVNDCEKIKEDGVAETALRDKDDLIAKRKALQDLERDPGSDKEAIRQRKLDLEKEARSKNMSEGINADQLFDQIEEMVEAWAEAHGVDSEVIWEDFDSVDDHELLDEAAAWRTSKGKNKNGGLNAKGVASYRRENPGSKLQTAVTTKPSKLKKGSKAAKRRKSFCARMGGVKGPMKKPNGKPTRKALALRKWNC